MSATMPARFSEATTMRQARKHLREAASLSPVLPRNLGNRWGVHLLRRLSTASEMPGWYEVHVFDRASPWIMPRFQRSICRQSLRVAIADAVTWMEDRAGEISANAENVNSAIITQSPLNS